MSNEPQPIKVFPAGTNVRTIDVVDRGIKMHFKCRVHPDTAEYVSKNPSHSRVFLASPGDVQECPHAFRDDVWILVSDYKPTRND